MPARGHEGEAYVGCADAGGVLIRWSLSHVGLSVEVTRDLVRKYLATQHLGHEPETGEVEGSDVHVTQHGADPAVVTQ